MTNATVIVRGSRVCRRYSAVHNADGSLDITFRRKATAPSRITMRTKRPQAVGDCTLATNAALQAEWFAASAAKKASRASAWNVLKGAARIFN